MTTSDLRELQGIERNIAACGHHIYLVSGVASPRFAYTVGLTDVLGAELVLAGGLFYDADEVKRIINAMSAQLGNRPKFDSTMEVEALGSFSLREVCEPWVKSLLLGAVRYYKGSKIKAYQILPDETHWTVDIPDLGMPWSATSEPVWRWHFEEWPYAIPRESVAVVNLDALRGQRTTHAARWEEDQWEIFVGSVSDIAKEDTRVVPLGMLLGVDPSLRVVFELAVGDGIARDDEDGEWEPWEDDEAES